MLGFWAGVCSLSWKPSSSSFILSPPLPGFVCTALAILNSLCVPGWPRTQKAACLFLQSARTKGKHHHARPSFFIVLSCLVLRQSLQVDSADPPICPVLLLQASSTRPSLEEVTFPKALPRNSSPKSRRDNLSRTAYPRASGYTGSTSLHSAFLVFFIDKGECQQYPPCWPSSPGIYRV